MHKVVGIGNALVDIMTSLDDDRLLIDLHLPKGSMQLVDLDTSNHVLRTSAHLPRSVTAGGSASNTIYGLARLGVESAFIGKIGNDDYGRAYADDLALNRILPKLMISLTHSGRAVALISADSERTFATHLGAAMELIAEDLLENHFTGFHILHIEGYLVQNYPLITRAVELARKAGLLISIDLASYNVVEEHKGFLEKLLSEQVDIIFANEEEAKAFTGMDPYRALEILGDLADYAIVKTGPKGSLVKNKNQVFHIDAIPAQCIDTTGAGDLYASGFLYGLVNGCSPENCGKIGSLLAGNIIEVVGARMDDPRWARIMEQVSTLL